MEVDIKIYFMWLSRIVVTSSVAGKNLFLVDKLSNIIDGLHSVNNLILCFIWMKKFIVKYTHIFTNIVIFVLPLLLFYIDLFS